MAIELAAGRRDCPRPDYAIAAVLSRRARSPGRKRRRAEAELDGRSGRREDRVHDASEVRDSDGGARSALSSIAPDAGISRRRFGTDAFKCQMTDVIWKMENEAPGRSANNQSF